MRTCTKKLAPHLLESLCKGYINAKNAYGEVLTIPELNIEIRYIPQPLTQKMFHGSEDLETGKLKLVPGARMSGKRYAKEQLDELKKIWLEGDWQEYDDEVVKKDQKKSKTPVMDIVENVKAGIKQKREETMKVNLEIAKICHQVNRDYCIDEQLVAPPKWDELPLIVQESIVAGVAEVIADPKISPTEIHQKWCDYKEAEGWKYGEEISVLDQLHPNLVPFKDLPGLEKRKDFLFIRTVRREMKK